MAVDFSKTVSSPPPKTSPRTTSGVRAERASVQQREQRKEGIAGLFQLVSLPLILSGKYADAGAVATHAPTISEETAKLAETDERIAKAIDKLIMMGPYAGLVAAVVPLALQILVNHNRLPYGQALQQFGVIPPTMLETRMQADLARQQAELIRDQAAAERELAAELDSLRADNNGRNPAETPMHSHPGTVPVV